MFLADEASRYAAIYAILSMTAESIFPRIARDYAIASTASVLAGLNSRPETAFPIALIINATLVASS
jgi:hypothetical protein